MRPFLIALSFFTRIPVRVKGDVGEDEFFNSMRLLPLVGLLIGLLLLYFTWLCSFISFYWAKSFLTLTLYLCITGGLHLDGLADTADAVLSARERERMFEIMKDSRLGAFGAIFLVMTLLGFFVGFSYLYYRGPLIGFAMAPVVGRFGALELAVLSEPASGKGLGKEFCSRIKGGDVAIYGALILAAALLLCPFQILAATLASFLWPVAMARYFSSKLGGVTGDQFGYIIETTQVLFLLCCVVFADVSFPWLGPFQLAP